MGRDYVQYILNKLDYGNSDISECEVSMNNIIFPYLKSLKSVNGFWQESSLQISPCQQVEAVKKIFEDNEIFMEKNLNLVKNLMFIENNISSIKVYSKSVGKRNKGRLLGRCVICGNVRKEWGNNIFCG